MLKYIKERKAVNKFFIVFSLFMVLSIVCTNTRARAAEYSATLNTDRASGVCTYTVTGIDTAVIQEMTLKVTYSDKDNVESSAVASANPRGNGSVVASASPEGNDNVTASANPEGNDNVAASASPENNDNAAASASPENNDNAAASTSPENADSTAAPIVDNNVVTVLEQKIVLDNTNCVNGTYTGSFSMENLEKYLFEEYSVSFTMGQSTENVEAIVVDAGKCDFTIHGDAYKLEVTGNRYDINRTFNFTSDLKDDVAVPGMNNKIQLIVWREKSDISKAVLCGAERELTGTSKTWENDLSTICSSYNKYNAAIVLVNPHIEKNSVILASTDFQVALVYSNVGSKKSVQLEKKSSFRAFVGSLNSGLGIDKVKFGIYNKKDALICSKTAERKAGTAYYYADISLKSLDYKLDVYTIKATVTDNVGNKRLLSKTGKVDMRMVRGTMDVQKKASAVCNFRVEGFYIPGNAKNVNFNIYTKNNGKQKFYKKFPGVYTSSSKSYAADMSFAEKGNYIAYAYVTTQWGKSVLLNKKSFKIRKSDLGKNGWIYEVYGGKEYKLYYKNNKLVTDLTDILGLKKTGNKLYLEVNRAAGCVTAYAYDNDKKAYIIPVKAFTVSVGRDTSSTGTAAALNINTSFTPLGSYSISSNGATTKYTLKPMNEPDGSVVYARWATHIVGNVYFHAIAVGSQSHYALSPSTYNKLGSPASAGCIRMTVADAKWIYDYASSGSEVNIVMGSSSKPGPLGKTPTITVDYSINYDPTDPDVPNSRKKTDYNAGHISGYMTKTGKKIGY